MKICANKKTKVLSQIYRLVKMMPYGLVKSLIEIKVRIEKVPADDTMVDPFTKSYLKENMMFM